MKKSRVTITLLLMIVVLESVVLASFYLGQQPQKPIELQPTATFAKSFIATSDEFNQPISNDTEYKLNRELDGSWKIVIQNNLVTLSSNAVGSEAQVAIAPEYRVENLSIPTLIVQERGDGFLRIEYYAQNWNNTFGLVLYNSTSPGWSGGGNLTLDFRSFGPPVEVNPQVAPYPNGNLTLSIGNDVVLLNYPIAWAGLSDFYVYGLRGSTFLTGAVEVTVYEVRY